MFGLNYVGLNIKTQSRCDARQESRGEGPRHQTSRTTGYGPEIGEGVAFQGRIPIYAWAIASERRLCAVESR